MGCYEQERPPRAETVEGSFRVDSGVQKVINPSLYASSEVFGPFFSLRNIFGAFHGRTKSLLKDPLSDGQRGRDCRRFCKT